jgi:(2R)-sulfolactate sulfo-lyase subunit beta
VVEAGGTVIFGETSALTGGEHLSAERCTDGEVRAKFHALYDDYVAMIDATGANLLGSTQGNIAGGLSTIEEKALGSIVKTGNVPIVGALESAEVPTRAGLNFMDTSSAAAECVTLMTTGGRQPVPHRPGQRHRQPGPAGHEDHGEPKDGRVDG